MWRWQEKYLFVGHGDNHLTCQRIWSWPMIWQIKTWNRRQPPLRHEYIYIYIIRKNIWQTLPTQKNNVAKHVDTCKTCTMALILWCHSSLNSFGNGTIPFFLPVSNSILGFLFHKVQDASFYCSAWCTMNCRQRGHISWRNSWPRRRAVTCPLRCDEPRQITSEILILQQNWCPLCEFEIKIHEPTGHLPPIIVQIITLK